MIKQIENQKILLLKKTAVTKTLQRFVFYLLTLLKFLQFPIIINFIINNIDIIHPGTKLLRAY